MATVDKTWTFTADAEGLADVGDSAITFAKDAGDASVHFSGAASGTQERGRRASTGQTWETWGVPAGATVTSVQVRSWQSRKWAAPASQTPTISMRVVDSAGASVHSAAGDLISVSLGTGADTGWVSQGQGTERNVDSGKQASTTDVRLEIELDVSVASSTWDVGVDTILLRITYTGGAPGFGVASTGTTDAGGAWTHTCDVSPAAGRVLILQVLQDGTTNGAVTLDSITNAENLAGTDNTLTQITGPNGDGSWPVGSAAAARQFLYIGRCLSSSNPVASGSNSTSEDLYIRAYSFDGVNTGTTLAAVIENSTAGSAVNSAGTSTSVADAGVTTLGAYRLALNFVAINDDTTTTAFTGETGGDWAEAATYGSASGTDGQIQLQTALMASAGTINGGTYTIASLAWGAVGFALIGAGAAARTIEATAGSYAVTGAAATLLEGRLLSANAGAYAVAGAAATLVFGRTLSADPGTYAVTGADATLLEGRVLSADPGSYAITGADAALLEGRLLTADPGVYAVTGTDANLGLGRALLADPGSYAVTGSAASLLADSVLSADPGSYALTGAAAQLLAGRAVSADPGVYAVTGGQATLLRGLVVQLDAGTYAVTGADAALLTVSSYLLSADPGAYSVTGTAAEALAGRLLTTDAGVFAVTGSQSSLVTARVLSLDNGVYAITGQDATLAAGRVLAADPGAYLITGADAELVFQGVGAFVLSADPGSYAVSGAAASLTAGYLLVADDGAYLITGADAALLAGRLLAADPGAYVVTGSAADLTHTLAAAFVLSADPGVYLITGNAATLTVTVALTGPGAVVGGDTTLVHVTGGDHALSGVTGGDTSRSDTLVNGGTTGRSRALGGDRTTAYASSGDRRSDP